MSFATPDMFTDYVIDGKGIHKQTNADHIRAMSDEELAEYLPIIFDMVCQPTDECRRIVCYRGECSKTEECALKWLQEEAEG